MGGLCAAANAAAGAHPEFPDSSIYPNPFNPVTAIHFTLSEPQHVTLSAYTLTGQLVETLLSETKSRGSHSATWDGSDRASGVYLRRLAGADQVSRVQKMVLIK